MNSHNLWLVGNVFSVMVGAMLSWEYTLSIGAAGCFACQLLVDIRREIQEKP